MNKNFPDADDQVGDDVVPCWSNLEQNVWYLVLEHKIVKTAFGCRMLLKIYHRGVKYSVFATDILAERIAVQALLLKKDEDLYVKNLGTRDSTKSVHKYFEFITKRQ